MIDLDIQLRELFQKEEMFAFFDFLLPLGEESSVAGLCKVCKPKAGKQQTQYFSLFFLIDSPSDEVWEKINRAMDRSSWDSLTDKLRGVDTILAIPHSHPTGGLYFKEVDIYLSKGECLSKNYLSSVLLPTIVEYIGCRAGEIVFWENLPAQPKLALYDRQKEKESALPLTERLREFLGF